MVLWSLLGSKSAISSIIYPVLNYIASGESELIRGNLALYAMYAGDFETAATEARLVLDGNPAYETAYVALALAELGRGETDATIKTYESLRAVSSWGASLAATGLADLALYQGRLDDARSLLERGIAGDRAAGNEGEAARKLIYSAHVDLAAGRPGAAVESVTEALAARTMARMTALRPGQSPPPVITPIR